MSKFFTSFKGRNVLPGQKVEVYRNLNKPGVTYSIRDNKTGLVLGHGSNLLLSRCKFIVNQKGRQKVITTKRKGIHAWVEGHFGIIHAGDDKIFSEGIQVQYNPYTNSHFEMVDCQEPIVGANVVWIDEHSVIASAIIRSWETRSIFSRPIGN